MNHRRLSEILEECRAEFVQADFWTLSPDGNAFSRRWAIDRSDAADAEQFLKLYTSAANWRGNPDERFPSVTNPKVSGGSRSGLYRGGRVSARARDAHGGRGGLCVCKRADCVGPGGGVRGAAGVWDVR